MQKKVLLIHEDQVLCDSLREVFVSYGYSLIQLGKNDAVAELLANENPDAIIMTPSLVKDQIENLVAEFRLAEKAELKKAVEAAIDPHSRPISPESAAAAAPNQGAAEKLRAFQSAFIAVKIKYARALPEKVEQLGADIQSAIKQVGNLAAVEPVRQLSHKLVGTAGSYGYEKFAMHIRKIEQAAIEISKCKNEETISRLWLESKIEFELGLEEARYIAEQSLTLDANQADETRIMGPVFARVLLVDEDQAFLDVVEQLGRQCNVAIYKASDVPQAMSLALMHQLDAAIIDVNVDSQDKAFALALDLRSLPGYDTVPLAFISSDAKVRPAVEAAHVGASLHLDKPLDVNSLEAAVRHLVAIRQGGRAKVMIVDDDPDFTARIALDLNNDNLLVRSVNDPRKVLEALQDFPPDVMLLDVMMPGLNGFEVCQTLRNLPRWRDLPIIFITAEIHIDARVKAFTSGGDDYLPKPVVTEELLARVRVRLEKSRLLKERSDKDTITGLLLRRAFVEQFNAMLADAERNSSAISVCLMDLDHFKNVNDSYGHMAGDKVLSGFGQLLLRRFRVDDLRGRWGGEEFIVAFRRETKETMRAAINRVQEEFNAISFASDEGKQFQASFSGGIASYPEDGSNLHELLVAADRRLYEAKHAGRRRVFISDEK